MEQIQNGRQRSTVTGEATVGAKTDATTGAETCAAPGGRHASRNVSRLRKMNMCRRGSRQRSIEVKG